MIKGIILGFHRVVALNSITSYTETKSCKASPVSSARRHSFKSSTIDGYRLCDSRSIKYTSRQCYYITVSGCLVGTAQCTNTSKYTNSIFMLKSCNNEFVLGLCHHY